MKVKDEELIHFLDGLAIVTNQPEDAKGLFIDAGLENFRHYSDIDLRQMSYPDARKYVINLLKHQISEEVKELLRLRGNYSFEGVDITISGGRYNYIDGKTYKQEYKLNFRDFSLYVDSAYFELKNTYVEHFQAKLPFKIDG